MYTVRMFLSMLHTCKSSTGMCDDDTLIAPVLPNKTHTYYLYLNNVVTSEVTEKLFDIKDSTVHCFNPNTNDQA